ncbi:MAG: glycoside hydrolase family 1 protein, partial [Elusimicrobia bacterium]|nr:glycoside hydrolase family 1 protein [Elusimicrobiota bacterium]
VLERSLGSWLFRLAGGRRCDRTRTDMGWEIAPEGFERVVSSYWQAYRTPILITENGIADATGARREAYIRDHLAALGRAMKAGAKVTGYLHWSLVDNYEWGSYKPKFGLYHVDKKKGFERVPAPGAEFYASVAASGELQEPQVV